ncbi:Gustatory receptor [Aphis craccivora]|uniref:Gustatory receptor n=1 Tax=Aphis craccivora TaxID=307492 RepID=A0A6G0YQY4_APHCR|nr:Gustatory receptor [Aphis craccivora]
MHEMVSIFLMLPLSVLFITVIKMTTFFHRTLRPILILSKYIGLIDISYTMGPTGLLVHNVKSLFHICIEISRIIVLLMFTYMYIYKDDSTIRIIQIFTVLQFWINIIAARLSNNWISDLILYVFRFINGMIEFDRKLTPFSTSLLSKQRSFSKRQWDIFLISFFLYFIVLKFLHFYLMTFKVMTVDIFIIPFILFAPPFILDYVITSSLCYFLHNLHARFWTLNDLWKCLPAEMVVHHDKWTHIEMVLFMEKTRLLHSELCDLLKKFTIGFGPLLLAYFTFSFSCLLIGIFLMVTNFHLLAIEPSAAEVWFQIFNVTDHIQIVISIMSIIVYVSFIEEQRTKIISYLRSYRISNLNMDVKKQIKMFMNQMSFSGLDQITAFGFFNVNLNLVMSILVLIITGITTLVQMKHDPIIIKLHNDTFLFIKSMRKNMT